MKRSILNSLSWKKTAVISGSIILAGAMVSTAVGVATAVQIDQFIKGVKY